MKKILPPKRLALAMVAVLSLALVVTGAMAESVESSTAKITFTAPTPLFTIEGYSPSGEASALNIDFAGVIPLLPSTSYNYKEGGVLTEDRWLKITDTMPLASWNVTASMGMFSNSDDGENTPVFGARIKMDSLISYRQIDTSIEQGDAVLSGNQAKWPAAALAGDKLYMVSGEGAVNLTANLEEAELGYGYFFVSFAGEGIAIDQLSTQEGQKLEVDKEYVATVTWTGVPTAIN